MKVARVELIRKLKDYREWGFSRLRRRRSAVADADDAVGVVRDVALVGDEDDRVAFGVKLVEELHDLDAV